MPKDQIKKRKRNLETVSVDKKADILQANFKHYFDMAMDHHTKAGTTSNLLLIIVGAIIGFIGFDNMIGGVVDFFGGLAVTFLGIFGVFWARKQHERYHFWEHIAYEYQKELTNIMPELKTAEPKSPYSLAAEDYAAEMFGSLFAKDLKDRYLWVSLHFFVMVIGVALMVLAALQK